MSAEERPSLTRKQIIKLCDSLLKPYRITDGRDFKLSRHKPDDIGPFCKKNKKALLDKFELGVTYLESLQEVFYADGRFALLLVLQAMDAAGKDGTIKHVMGGLNPQGCHVSNFKKPSEEEHRHDFLWRCAKQLPERGMIGIFNRSHYEEVLSVKVHPEWLGQEGFDSSKADGKFWKQRYESIVAFERHLAQNHTHSVKIFLHLSRKEQAKRLLSRLDTPAKNWKFSPDDVAERRCWKDYQKAFEDMVRHTSSKEAPWYVVPADNKWFSRIVVLCALIEKLASLNPAYPEVGDKQMEVFDRLRHELEN